MSEQRPADDDSFDPELSPDSPDRPWRARSMAASWGSFIPILGMAACAYLLAQSKDDLIYLFSSSVPVDLGQPGDYHMDRAKPGVYARIVGEVHSHGTRFQEGHSPGIIWPLTGAPVVVARHDSEPLWGRVEADGRLQSDDQLVAAFHKPIAVFLMTEDLGSPGPHGHVWLLTQGRVPRGFDRTNLWLVGLMLLFLINTWLVVRPMLRRR